MSQPSVCVPQYSPLDHFRPGYPKFSALLAVHPSFQNFRRFSRARIRLLLLKQDEITELEKSLDLIDANEERILFLGCARRDGNLERREVLVRMRQAISEYDEMLTNYHRALSLPNSDARDVDGIKNWIDGTGCIARAESEYLEHGQDMLNVSGPVDTPVNQIDIFIENCALRIKAYVQRRAKFLPISIQPGRRDITKDENIFFMGNRLRAFSRAVTTLLITTIVLTPVVALFCIHNAWARLIVIIVAATFFLSALTKWTKAKTIEIFTVGASYTAVLVVFTSATNTFKPT